MPKVYPIKNAVKCTTCKKIYHADDCVFCESCSKQTKCLNCAIVIEADTPKEFSAAIERDFKGNPYNPFIDHEGETFHQICWKKAILQGDYSC